MIALKIKLKDGTIKDYGRFINEEEMNKWLEPSTSQEHFGKNDHYEKKLVTPAVYDEMGLEVSPAIYQDVFVPKEYELIKTDITAQDEAEKAADVVKTKKKSDALAYIATLDTKKAMTTAQLTTAFAKLMDIIL